MTLEQIREKIDQIDNQLVTLFTERMEAAGQVAEIKKGSSGAVYQSAREQEILAKVQAAMPAGLEAYAAALYSTILELSRNRQRDLLALDTPFALRLKALADSAPLKSGNLIPRVCVQGVTGSYAEKAAKLVYPDSSLQYVEKWGDVLQAVEDGKADYGVLPIENSAAGSVLDVYDLLIRTHCSIVRAIPVSIDHYLLGQPGAALEGIRSVYSHPQALSQCAAYLKAHPTMTAHVCDNTAGAARLVAQMGDPTCAAIASEDCASLFGLEILDRHIQQNAANCTRFVSVAKEPEFSAEANKISLVFTLPHVTGSLSSTLTRFALNGLNLTKIESRPVHDRNFEYYFYLDFTGSISSAATAGLLAALQEELPVFYFLGNYPESEPLCP